MWTSSNDERIKLAEEEVYKINLVPKEAKILNSTVVKVPKSYPVYEIGYQSNIDIISAYLDNIDGLQVIGRYGAFKYNNQDHSILMGLLAADNIVENKKVDLWAINTDTEYQEESKIKDVLIQ